jgi:cholesterol oxidase
MKALGRDTVHADQGGETSLRNRLVDLGLRALPVELEEWCTSPVCKRITFLYGPSYQHDQINLATHDTLHELFGVVNLTVIDHLAQMVRAGHVINADGTTCLRNLERLAFPITFVHGAENGRFRPGGTLATMEALREANGEGLYRHEVVPGYGDTDCLIGKHANRDFYPRVLHHLKSVAAATR